MSGVRYSCLLCHIYIYIYIHSYYQSCVNKFSSMIRSVYGVSGREHVGKRTGNLLDPVLWFFFFTGVQ